MLWLTVSAIIPATTPILKPFPRYLPVKYISFNDGGLIPFSICFTFTYQ
jgi:hypothetical protein